MNMLREISKHPPCSAHSKPPLYMYMPKRKVLFCYTFLQGQSDDSSDEGDASGDTESTCQRVGLKVHLKTSCDLS